MKVQPFQLQPYKVIFQTGLTLVRVLTKLSLVHLYNNNYEISLSAQSMSCVKHENKDEDCDHAIKALTSPIARSKQFSDQQSVASKLHKQASCADIRDYNDRAELIYRPMIIPIMSFGITSCTHPAVLSVQYSE